MDLDFRVELLNPDQLELDAKSSWIVFTFIATGSSLNLNLKPVEGDEITLEICNNEDIPYNARPILTI